MNQSSLLTALPITCEAAVGQVIAALQEIDLQVTRSFDLQVARATHTECTCPHHGTARCDCQMVILQVYSLNRKPVTLIAHGYASHTKLELADGPLYRPIDRYLIENIRTAITLKNLKQINQDLWADAT